MASSPMSEILQHLHRTVLPPDGAGLSDGELLQAFVTRRDDAAFAALVRRHGPMVWGVCRRVVPGHQDAEDAFQATFLVLVRKAASVVPREMVANWLYGVAHQTARNARASAARRSARERQVTQMPEPATPEREVWRDLQGVLDQELSRLPDKYRVAIVLCDLEGKTRKDVAGQLGVPEGTLSGRLTRGRAILARRLARHGLGVSGAALAAVLSQNAAAAAVPAGALSSTINAASLLAAGHAAAAGALSAQVVALADGVVRTMLVTKLKIVTAVVLVLSAAGLGATGLLYRAHPGEPMDQPVVPIVGLTGAKPKPTPVAARLTTAKSKFTLDKETTYITEPLDKDGYVDYETALNERLSKDIVPERNANVLLLKALGPHPLGATMPADFFQWLKIPAPPEGGEYWINLGRYAKEDLQLETSEQTNELHDQQLRTAQRPWVERDYPQIAAWLKANEKPLAVVLEASKRTDYYNPLVSRKSGEEGWYGLLGVVQPHVQTYRELAIALCARAMLHAGEGKFEEAWQELLACHRLGRLTARGATLLEFLVGFAINLRANDAELALLDRARPRALQARAWLRDLQRLPPSPSIADQVDRAERFMFLNTVLLVRRSGIKTLRLIARIEELEPRQPGPKEPDPETPHAIIDALDWDTLLRTGNRWFDRTVAALRIQDRPARERELQRIEEELQALKKDAGSLGEVIEVIRGGKAPVKEVSQRLGDTLTCSFLLGNRRIHGAADRFEQVQRNLHVAFALAAYHAEQGRYPEKLDALAPAYLEEIPNDLFSGKALIYQPSAQGYLLYSVGVNGRDEQGHGADDTPPGDDLRVSMPLPELKHK
jgi:RNA polymerase sigma factor (sigma-70 family)